MGRSSLPYGEQGKGNNASTGIAETPPPNIMTEREGRSILSIKKGRARMTFASWVSKLTSQEESLRLLSEKGKGGRSFMYWRRRLAV